MNSRDQAIDRSAPLPAPLLAPVLEHEHGWRVESSHRTSAGLVVYVVCGECAARRVDLQEAPCVPPSALSRELC
ncbi:hypothetical protein [Zhihengliuella flava]|uniref:Uncharacterized protein n=1 Tax=Zhihengliuella flava TaxID=1285193 RepID=A0A931D9U0_9MICC|nr:hypothetical protein [Zhihengliuella flava]MBG6084658.1 hypothetical protein [Zhihengliuella flava]